MNTKDDASELFQLLINCDVFRISYENFGSTIFNYEDELELQNKIIKFRRFNQEQIPPAKPIIDDLVNFIHHSANNFFK